ncbi:branched-chain amino acid ABC transporter permease [Rhizobium sp. L1K21]|uniref:branched-chain amino acid ABC transporter permease n=1 Tax=Rhizobium sp. L1K21 TaxID=2954933 RepID=UPI002093C580|nr:branched-chain amino acid ABC transporter permease [Rhizobium sp. L1K21]MCO6188357.1 branched-chain amino acid ABC transporter permease [Rhizobium sp. L1K21]
MGAGMMKSLILHLAVLVLLFLLQFVISDYAILTLTRMMVLGIFASGFNILFGYTGLLSLGHAMFFGAGVYAAGLPIYHFGWSVPLAFVFAIFMSFVAAVIIGVIALRTVRDSFMILTLMLAQAGYLAILYFNRETGGSEGLTMPQASRSFDFLGLTIDLTDAATRYNIAVLLLAITIVVSFILIQGRYGRLFNAIRENEARTEMLGYNVLTAKLFSFTVSGTIAGMAGAAYAILFGYIGATFAGIQYSIEALLFTLLGGAGTLLGPLLGSILMTTLIDRLSEVTSAYFLFLGLILIALTLWFPKGLLGTIKEKWLPWLT